MILKLGHLVFVYIGPYPLCLDVRFNLRILKISLEMFLQDKIKILCEKLVHRSTRPVFRSTHAIDFEKPKPLFSIYQHIGFSG